MIRLPFFKNYDIERPKKLQEQFSESSCILIQIVFKICKENYLSKNSQPNSKMSGYILEGSVYKSFWRSTHLDKGVKIKAQSHKKPPDIDFIGLIYRIVGIY